MPTSISANFHSGCAECLELVNPSGSSTSKSYSGGTKAPPRSLLEMLNKTRTSCGSRLLRANLIQPLIDIPTLEMRYDCVEELLDDSEVAHNVTQVKIQPSLIPKYCFIGYCWTIHCHDLLFSVFPSSPRTLTRCVPASPSVRGPEPQSRGEGTLPPAGGQEPILSGA